MKPLADPRAITPEQAEALERRAQRAETPCGAGSMVWRRWGEGAQAIVLLHGGAGSWVHWVRNIEALSESHTVWVPDLPGMGASDLPPEPWTPQSVADIVHAGAGQLLGAQAFVVAGFSFGGMVGGHLAARHPDAVRALVLVDAAGTGVSVDPGPVLQSWRKEPDPERRREIHRQNLGIWMLYNPASADALAAALVPGAVEADRLKNREVSRTDSMARALATVRCPVFGIWGEQDILFRQSREALASLMREAGVPLRWIAGAGHWAQYERAAEVNAALLEILQGLPPG